MARSSTLFVSPTESPIGKRLTALMSIGFLALVAAGIAAAWMTQRNQGHARWVEHTYRVENAIIDLRRLIEEGETTRRGYLLAPDVPLLRTIHLNAARALPGQLAALSALVADNALQRRNVAALNRQLAPIAQARARSIALIDAGQVEQARALFHDETASRPMVGVRRTMERMVAIERTLLDQRDRDLKKAVNAFYIMLALTGVLLLVVAAVSLAAVLTYTRDLTRSRDTLNDLNANLEAIVADRTADLTRANEEIQRFAYIVSHDLRSPLVNVMGFTAELEASTQSLTALIDRAEAEAPQLVGEEARLAVREDLPEAISFIRTSTQKMDRLINAILMLSRQGRRVLSPEPIDMVALFENIRDAMTHRLTEADTELVIEQPMPDLVSDRFSIDQILSNLVDNAVKYLKPGVPGRIVVRGRRLGARAIIEVADNGRGIDPRDHARVFDLFRRSGTQDRPGEGIGLATVRALVFRLGGHIEVSSTLGEGATFRLTLPLSLEPQDRSE
ncbi:CHASE3 domain-containing protein [Sphingomonas sp. RHCKR47]|uniref:sensor histidine kinase n=1 Tax=Sphingomonas citricola TaxID=2862498 RepID=UPI001CA5BF3C|nr:sensor histidine kinase [Sphingomonas citricola]MBW6522186.1 CHASE3 domain-containing protein [Sphingomonas citricola]